MATAKTCDSVLNHGDDVLHCGLPAEHVEPTEEFPQGTPHEADDFLDQLTGKPWSWYR